MSHYAVSDLPSEERPRERLKKHGPAAMTTAELIAVILGSGTKGVSVLQLSHDIMTRFETPQKLAEASLEELSQIRGLGPAKALQLKAAVSLGLRVSKQSLPPKTRIDHPVHAYHLVKDELENEKRELFIVILLNTKGYSIGQQVIAIGTLSNISIDPREVFFPAVRHKAASIVLIHNHPSGDPTPSPEDLEVTKTLIGAGRLMGIPVNDHLIIGNNTYTSLRQKGVDFS